MNLKYKNYINNYIKFINDNNQVWNNFVSGNEKNWKLKIF